MAIRTFAASALVAVGLVTIAAPALAQGTRTVHVMGLSFEQPTGPSNVLHSSDARRTQAR